MPELARAVLVRSYDLAMTDSTPSWVMPAETDPHERTIMCWPTRPQIWQNRMRQAQLDYAEIARSIAGFEPVTMICRPEHAEVAADMCGSDTAYSIEVMEIPIDDSWVRDSGPVYALDRNGRRIANDFIFNAWGEKFFPHNDDAKLAERFTDLRADDRRNFNFVLEGGAISVDGEGTLLTTQQCLFHPNRNPTMTRADIEAGLHDALGVSVVMWLPFGLSLDDDTDGHVDNVAAFAAPGYVVMQGCSDPDEEDAYRMEANRRWVHGSLDAHGEPISTLTVPVLPFVEVNDEHLCVPYLNYYVCNGAVLVPTTGHAADTDMLALIGSAYPDRTVVAVPGTTLALGGGGPHCITQQIPALGGVA